MSRVRVVLVDPIHEVNVGHVARVMKNFGFHELFLVNPGCRIDGAMVFASHGGDVLERAVLVEDLEAALEGMGLVVGTTARPARSLRNLDRQSISPAEFAERVAKYPGRCAIVFGRESTGLNSAEMSRCHLVVTIPADSSYPTLNVSHSAAILLYVLHETHAGARHGEEPNMRSLELLSSYFAGALKSLRLPPHRYRMMLNTFERVIRRGLVSGREVTLLLGAFRRIEKGVSSEPLKGAPLKR